MKIRFLLAIAVISMLLVPNHSIKSHKVRYFILQRQTPINIFQIVINIICHLTQDVDDFSDRQTSRSQMTQSKSDPLILRNELQNKNLRARSSIESVMSLPIRSTSPSEGFKEVMEGTVKARAQRKIKHSIPPVKLPKPPTRMPGNEGKTGSVDFIRLYA